MTTGSVIVTLATAWGPRYGGINAFNTELVKSLGILPTRHYELICVVPGPATQQLQDELLLRFHVQLLSLGAEDGFFATGSAAEIVLRLDLANDRRRFIWIGHDDKSGPLALELKSLVTSSYAVLINHMAHGAYQSVKHGTSVSAAEKRQRQLDLFSKADLCLAVGPMLRSHLQDLLARPSKSPPVGMLVPGLTDPAEYGVEIRDSAPENFVAFVAGRLDREEDRIKQGRLALRGFARAVRDADADSLLRRSPTLRMRGIHPLEEAPLRDLLMQESGRAVNFDFQDSTDDRSAYFRDLSTASVAMMPSWHEGFGLTGWEAIASAVPVVISEESGVYRLLNADCSGAGLGQSVAHIQIEGRLPSSGEEPNHTSNDVVRVATALLDLARRPADTKQKALTLLRNLLALGLDWKGTALGLVKAIETQLSLSLTAESPVTTQTTLSAPAQLDSNVPQWLRRPARRLWRPDLNLPTSLLLVARDEIVHFDPERESALEQVRQWALQRNGLSARLLFGPGGMGKTRLALELVHRLQRDGWLSLWLSSAAPKNWVESWDHLLRTRGRERLLLIIDYADARPIEVLSALNQALEWLRASSNPAAIRLLLLARSDSWRGSLPQHPNCGQELAAWLSGPTGIESQALAPWNRNDAARLASYRLALGDYSAAMSVTAPQNAYVPRLSERVFDRPLYLHLAALAALEGQRPASAEALLRDQLRREWRYWLATHGEAVASYDDWADAVAFVILRQGADADQLHAALAGLGIAAPSLVAALQRSYPAGDRIASLEPDLIAEALLRERLAERRGAALVDAVLGAKESFSLPPVPVIPLGQPVITRLAAQGRVSEGGQAPAWVRVLIAALVRYWWRHPNQWVSAAHGAEHGLGELLYEAWLQLDGRAREVMAQDLILPKYSTNLLRLTVAVRRQQLQYAPSGATKAVTLNNLAVALSHLGDPGSRAEALTCARETLLVSRELAQTHSTADRSKPDDNLANLAAALDNMALYLSHLGDAASRAEAVAFARQALLIRHELVGAVTVYLSQYLSNVNRANLATSLNNLAIYLREQRDATSRSEAMTCAGQALLIRRELAESDPAEYLPDLAVSLNSSAIRLAEQGDAASVIEALACARQAAMISSQLAEAEPAAYLPSLAVSLNTLANRLSEVSGTASHTEALNCARQSVMIYRTLAEAEPAAYLPGLSISLKNVVARLSEQRDVGWRTEALDCARQAVMISRQLAAIQPAAYLPDLATSLNTLAERLSEESGAASRTEMLACRRETRLIYHELHSDKWDSSEPLRGSHYELEEKQSSIEVYCLARGTGTIKTLNDRGFGFITREGLARDLFFHSNCLRGVTFDELKVDDAVSFLIEESPKGPNAVGVQRS